MFGWAVTFLLLAIVTGIFGFAGVNGPATAVAQVLCVLALILFVALLLGAHRRPGSATRSGLR